MKYWMVWVLVLRNDLSYLEESQSKRYDPRYYSKVGGSLGMASKNMPHETGRKGVGLINNLTRQGISINV